MTEGRCTRERDVEVAWEHVVTGICHAQPDLVTIAGDVFHSVRPSFFAVRAWQRGVRRILTETGAHLVVILGNHEAPKSAETLSPVVTAEDERERRLHIVTEPRRVRFRLDPTNELVSVACFPFAALTDSTTYALEPDPAAAVNILVMHAAVRSSARPDALPHFYSGDTAIDVGACAADWNAIALGDYHDFAQLVDGRPVFYSGAIERTSSNIWPEVSPKGFVTYDTQSQDLKFVPVPTRPVFDLGLDAFRDVDQLNRELHRLAESRTHLDAIVRLRVDDFARNDRDRIDWATVRALKSSCTHFQLDLRMADEAVVDLGDRREHRTRSLADAAREYFAGDPADVRACALGYLGLEAA